MPDTDAYDRLVKLTDRLEAESRKNVVAMAEYRAILKTLPCAQRGRDIQTLYERQDQAKTWLIGLLVLIVMGLLGVFFYELFSGIIASRSMS